VNDIDNPFPSAICILKRSDTGEKGQEDYRFMISTIISLNVLQDRAAIFSLFDFMIVDRAKEISAFFKAMNAYLLSPRLTYMNIF
jgi:hypothetical protein